MSENKAYISAPLLKDVSEEEYKRKVFSIRKNLEDRGFVFPYDTFYTYRLYFDDVSYDGPYTVYTSIDWPKLGLMPARLDQFCIYPKGYGLVYFCKGWEEDEYCREEHDLVTFKGIPVEYE